MWKDVVQGSQKAFMYQREIAIWQLPELQNNEGSSHNTTSRKNESGKCEEKCGFLIELDIQDGAP